MPLYNNGGALTVTNCTFSGNSGGTISNTGTLTVNNCTFSGNSGSGSIPSAFSNLGTLTLTNTIVANSTKGKNCSGTIIDGGRNIDDGTSCGFRAANGSLSSTNPQLDSAGLANNGGPTQTIALQAGSPAIDAGDESVCSAPPVDNLDQRGYVRPGTDAMYCSIGAYEFDSPGFGSPTPTSSMTPPPSNTPTPISAPCVGDCDGNGQVTIDELLTLVNIALGNADVSTCLPGDANHDQQITIDEILTAANNALNGCSGG